MRRLDAKYLNISGSPINIHENFALTMDCWPKHTATEATLGITMHFLADQSSA